MNCRRFQSQLFEYMDETLPAEETAAARRHLAGCSVCRRAVRKEQRIAQALSTRLGQHTESLTLRPEIARQILAASRTARPAATESLAVLWMRWLRLAAMPVSLTVIVAFLLVAYYSGRPTRPRTSVPVVTHPATPTATNGKQPEISIEMSYRMPVRRFYREGNLVVDTFVDETIVANGTIPSGSQKNLPQKIEIKTPL